MSKLSLKTGRLYSEHFDGVIREIIVIKDKVAARPPEMFPDVLSEASFFVV